LEIMRSTDSSVDDHLNQLKTCQHSALAILNDMAHNSDTTLTRRLGRIRRSALMIIEEVDEISARNAQANFLHPNDANA
jgi:hypothetical protein